MGDLRDVGIQHSAGHGLGQREILLCMWASGTIPSQLAHPRPLNSASYRRRRDLHCVFSLSYYPSALCSETGHIASSHC
jgi:hypothetical protein